MPLVQQLATGDERQDNQKRSQGDIIIPKSYAYLPFLLSLICIHHDSFLPHFVLLEALECGFRLTRIRIPTMPLTEVATLVSWISLSQFSHL